MQRHSGERIGRNKINPSKVGMKMPERSPLLSKLIFKVKKKEDHANNAIKSVRMENKMHRYLYRTKE